MTRIRYDFDASILISNNEKRRVRENVRDAYGSVYRQFKTFPFKKYKIYTSSKITLFKKKK